MSAPDFPPIRLVNEAARDRVRRLLASLPMGWIVRFSPPTRSVAQNALLHAVVAEAVAKGLASDNGRRLTEGDAKTAFVSAWQEEQGHASDIIAFAGHAVQLRRSTTTLTKAEFSSLIDFIFAECAHRGIILSERSP